MTITAIVHFYQPDFHPLFKNQADYTHYTVIFNVFVFCQIFNEFNARSIGDNWKASFQGLATNPMFLLVIFISIVVQIIFVQFFGNYTKTAGLSIPHWGISIAIGAGSVPVGVIMRFIPVAEDQNTYRGYSFGPAGDSASAKSNEAESEV